MTTKGGLLRRTSPHAGRPIPRSVVAAWLCLVAATGCARTRPVAAPAVVALDVPPPPARVISTPPEPVAPVESTTVERPAPATRPSRSGRTASARPEAPKPAEARAESGSETPASAAPEVTAAPAPLLRTPQTADESNAEKRTNGVLERATQLLDRVNATTLGQQARQQHETARRFVDQAKQALVERNYVLASYLADKAETLARGLSR